MNPRKILVIKLRALGDTVLLTAPVAELRAAYPGARIDVLVDARWASLLEGQPGIDRVWSYGRRPSRTARARAVARLAWGLRREGYDCVVNLHASPSSATLALATGARTRAIHFHGHRHRNRFSTVEIPGKGVLKPIIERDMDTVRALGPNVPTGRLPRITVGERDREAAAWRLEKLGSRGPLLALGLGASRPTKVWPLERFAALALEWNRRTGGSTLALGGPGEAEALGAFMNFVEELAPAAEADPARRAELRARIATENSLALRPLAAVLARATLFVGNDSGPKHLAVAVGTPTVTLFGPEHPFEWHPYPRDRHPYLFVETLDCRRDNDPGMPAWCGLQICVAERHRCMRMLGVDQVLEECRKLVATA